MEKYDWLTIKKYTFSNAHHIFYQRKTLPSYVVAISENIRLYGENCHRFIP
jgi:hypothetical protein